MWWRSPFTGDIAFWLLFIGLFAAGAWIVLGGGACGVLLLMLEFWLFFDVTPWAYADGMDESDRYALTGMTP